MTERPRVLVNMAMTADGKVDTAARRGARISTADDDDRVDALRAEVDAVMVGGRTLLAEDPRLTVRSAALVAARRQRGHAPQPTRVAVVSEIPASWTGTGLEAGSRFLHGETARVVVFTTERTPPAVRERLVAAGAEVVMLGGCRVDLVAALRHLARTGVERLLVEGGGTLVEALLRERLIDEIRLFVAPRILGGSDAPTPAEGLGFAVDDAVRLRLVEAGRLGDDGLLLHYVVEPPGATDPRGAAPDDEAPPVTPMEGR